MLGAWGLGVESAILGVGGLKNYKIQLSSVGHIAMEWNGSMETTGLAELLFCSIALFGILFNCKKTLNKYFANYKHYSLIYIIEEFIICFDKCSAE